MSFFTGKHDSDQRGLGMVLGAMFGVFAVCLIGAAYEWLANSPSGMSIGIACGAVAGAALFGGYLNPLFRRMTNKKTD